MSLYTYRATVVRWVDGDTVDLDVDLGFHLHTHDRFRLLGVDTPERGREGYDEATAFAEGMAPVGSEVTVTTTKTDSFGRYLARIMNHQHRDISHHLIQSGHGRIYT